MKKRRFTEQDQLMLEDIGWLMERIDVKLVLERLGIDVKSVSGKQIYCMCPDHHLYVEREPSHPKWTINIDDGLTYCFTEGRGSNLVYTVARIRDCEYEEAISWILESDDFDINLSTLNVLSDQFEKIESKKEEKTVARFHSMEYELEKGRMYKSGYEYFMYPPKKKPTLISKSTVDHFDVIQMRHGYYSNRVVIPFYMNEELVGFCATDILGESEWLERNLDKSRDDYKKIIYPKHFSRKDCLFNYDNIKKNSDVIITEGARDTMKLWQFGFQSVSILGTSMSSEHMKLLATLNPRRVVVMLDGDEAGYHAQNIICKQLESHFECYECRLPDGHDPKTIGQKELLTLIKKNISKSV